VWRLRGGTEQTRTTADQVAAGPGHGTTFEGKAGSGSGAAARANGSGKPPTTQNHYDLLLEYRTITIYCLSTAMPGGNIPPGR